MAMPEVGLDVTPTRPTMREETVTNRKAKITTQTEAIRRKLGGAPPPSEPTSGDGTRLAR